MTRRITAHLFSSLNGVSEDPHLFQFDAFGPEEGEFMQRALSEVTDVVLGDRLWREWSEYWPNAEDPFAAFINPVTKHVISSSLPADLGWNSTLIQGDPIAYVMALRETDGGAISILGGVETVRRLFLAGLIDALTLTVHPVITGQGRRLFDESVPTTRLRLIEGVTTSAGNAVLSYALRPAD